MHQAFADKAILSNLYAIHSLIKCSSRRVPFAAHCDTRPQV